MALLPSFSIYTPITGTHCFYFSVPDHTHQTGQVPQEAVTMLGGGPGIVGAKGPLPRSHCHISFGHTIKAYLIRSGIYRSVIGLAAYARKCVSLRLM